MGYLYLAVFAVLYCSGVWAYEPLLSACKVTDLECLRTSCTQFLMNSAKGVGEPYNIPTYDPLELPPFDMPGCCDESSRVHLKNVKVTGLKDTVLEDLKMLKEESEMTFNASVICKVTADITLELPSKSKTFSGTMETMLKTAIHTQYPFTMEKDESGKLHIVIHRETTTCEPKETPVVIYSPELKEATDKDPDIIALRATHKNEIAETSKRFACKIADMVFPKLIDAFRRSAKIMTINDYFTDFKEE